MTRMHTVGKTATAASAPGNGATCCPPRGAADAGKPPARASPDLKADLAHHPLLTRLDQLALELVGIRLAIVYPQADGWEQFFACGPECDECRPAFCQMIQRTPEGAKRCKTCHLLMSVAACGRGLREHRCHAGVSVLTTPATRNESEALAVLSTCVFTSRARKEAWADVSARGLGLDLAELKKRYEQLPELTSEQQERAQRLMEMATLAVNEIRWRQESERQLGRKSAPAGARRATAALEDALRRSTRAGGGAGATRARRPLPPVIAVVRDLVARKPHLALSVAELARAARMTPNYFSALFHKAIGESFARYLRRQRMARAKDLLRDATLSVREVAFQAGYEDPGYFIRLFRQETGRTPQQWRGCR